MRIIGGHDYYDSAGYGIDPTILFVRDCRLLEDVPMRSLPCRDLRLFRASDTYHTLYGVHVVLGGKLYPALRLTGRAEWEENLDSSRWLLTSEEQEAWLEEVARRVTKNRVPPFGARMIARLREHLATPAEPPGLLDWLIENRVVTGLIYSHARGRPRCMADIDCLGDIGFMRRIDPATAHMEIARWVGGVLPVSRPLVELSDADRIAKAGFDKVTSFRKGPGKRRRRK